MYKERISTCAERIAMALSTRGMRAAELSAIAKIPKSSLSLYIKGAYEPKQDKIYAMAKVLNVSEAWLLGYDVPMERKQIENPSEEQVLSEGKKKLLEFANSVPEEKIDLVLRVMQSIVEAD